MAMATYMEKDIFIKRNQLGLNPSQIYCCLWTENQNYHSLITKVLLYKFTLKPIWFYGVQLLGMANKSNIDLRQWFKNKVSMAVLHFLTKWSSMTSLWNTLK